jgi:hypothetical protein
MEYNVKLLATILSAEGFLLMGRGENSFGTY